MRQSRRLYPRAALVAITLTLSCRHASEPAPSPASLAAAAPGAEHGLDLASMDRSVAPGDDFFAYANGTWSRQTEIPPDRSSYGIGAQLAEVTVQRVRELLEAAVAAPAAPGTEPRKVADYYSTFMDEAGIEAQGLDPLAPVLSRIAALKSKAALSRMLGESLRADVDPLNATDLHTDRLFGLWVSPGFGSPNVNVPYLLQGGLGLPDRGFYLGQDPHMAEVREKYLAHVRAVFELSGSTDAEARAARVLALETRIAQAHAGREESAQVLSANNPWPRTAFSARAPGLDWPAFFEAAGLGQADVLIVWQPGAVAGLAALVASEPLVAWQDWLTFHSIDRRSKWLPAAFAREDFAFYGQALYGIPQLEERWKRAVRATNAALGDAVGKMYVARHFPQESKRALEEMVHSIVLAFGERVDRLDWMAPETKARAHAKLGTLVVGIGYPERWTDYAALDITRGDAVGNAERAELSEYRHSLAKLGQPVDKGEWWMVPQIVNAVNLPLQNALNFPAGILVPPFFDPTAPSAVNYAAIGAIIGHEISHSFDDQGAQFDENGKLSDWWTKADRQHFEASGARLVAQYDAYTPFADLHVNGKLTLGENIADLAGLAAAHDAWLASLGGKPAPVVQGFSGEQQFFLAFAQIWRGKKREAALRQQIVTDGHAPEQYRADTVRNFDAWYEAFGVTPQHALYLAPADRVRVW